MTEQAGVYKVDLIENNNISATYSGDNITSISGSGATINLLNDQEITFKFSPIRGKNNKIQYKYELGFKDYDLSIENINLMNQIRQSIYGWIAKIEFYNKEIKIVNTPLKFVNSNLNNAVSNHYQTLIQNTIIGSRMFVFGTPVTAGIGSMQIGTTFIVS